METNGSSNKSDPDLEVLIHRHCCTPNNLDHSISSGAWMDKESWYVGDGMILGYFVNSDHHC